MIYWLSSDAPCLLKRLCTSIAIRVTLFRTWGGYTPVCQKPMSFTIGRKSVLSLPICSSNHTTSIFSLTKRNKEAFRVCKASVGIPVPGHGYPAIGALYGL